MVDLWKKSDAISKWSTVPALEVEGFIAGLYNFEPYTFHGLSCDIDSLILASQPLNADCQYLWRHNDTSTLWLVSFQVTFQVKPHIEPKRASYTNAPTLSIAQTLQRRIMR